MSLFSIAAALMLVPASAYAQLQAGRIVGTVTDPTNAVISNAQVTVTEEATNVQHKVATSGTGDYVVTPLNPGIYTVRVSAAGFQTAVRSGVEVRVDSSVRIDAALALGDTATQVEIRADAPLLDTESGTLGHVINNKQIVDLPLNGRGFYELARLTPGAALLPGTGNVLRIRPEFVNGTTISGVRGRMISFSLDGMDISEQHQGGTFIQTSIDALQEFKVQQNAYSAEFSRAGGMLNATTKSGSNQIHGVLFEFLRNDKFDARNFFANKREILKRNSFGGTIGGPVVIPKVYNGRDRTFFFGSYEALRERQGLVFNSIVPTAAMKRGDYSAPGLSRIFDPASTTGTPATRTQFPGNVIPASRLSSQAAFFARYIPDANTPAGTASFAPSRALDQDQFTVRLDQNVNAANRLFVRWSWHDNRQQDPNAAPALGIAPLETRGQNAGASLTSNVTSTLIHEFRYSWLKSIIDLAPFLAGTDFIKEAGIRGFEDTGRPGFGGSFPDFLWSGFSALRGSSFDQRPKTQDRLVHEVLDNLTWVKGRHIAKFGGKIRYYKPLFTDSKQYRGDWNFTGINTENPAAAAGTGNAIADFALGLPASVVRAFPGNTFGGVGTYWQFFAQDDWKVSNRLTLNLGLRYEYTPFLRGYRGQVGAFDPTQSRPIIIASDTDRIDLDAQFAAKTAFPIYQDLIQTSSQAGLPLSITYPDKRQWAPRLGFAWRPVGERTVIRGGYGIFYETENTDGRVNLNMVPFKLDETVFNDRGGLPNRNMADFFLGVPIGAFSTASSINPTFVRMRMGYDQHWNFGVQRQFAGNLMAEVDYVANKGSFLNSGNAFNFPQAGPGNIQIRRPYPRFGNISINGQNVSSTYHALQAKFEKRLSHGIWYLASYSFSKAMSHEPQPAKGGNTAWEKALSDIDIPQNLAFSAGYEVPVGRGRRFAANMHGFGEAILGGWQLQGIYNIHSGRLFTPVVSRDVANTSIGGQRPNRIASGKLDSPTLFNWFDKSAFVAPANFTYGNSGARILREDDLQQLDISIFKEFRVREGQRLQFRAEFFNFTNTPSFFGPNPQIDTAAGGRVTATSTAPRQVQFALKYNF
jgi:hypothetical protein